MKIIFSDGSHADCSEIEFSGNVIVWDGCRQAPICDVERIEE